MTILSIFRDGAEYFTYSCVKKVKIFTNVLRIKTHHITERGFRTSIEVLNSMWDHQKPISERKFVVDPSSSHREVGRRHDYE